MSNGWHLCIWHHNTTIQETSIQREYLTPIKPILVVTKFLKMLLWNSRKVNHFQTLNQNMSVKYRWNIERTSAKPFSDISSWLCHDRVSIYSLSFQLKGNPQGHGELLQRSLHSISWSYQFIIYFFTKICSEKYYYGVNRNIVYWDQMKAFFMLIHMTVTHTIKKFWVVSACFSPQQLATGVTIMG